jgi:hypothetical protein
MATGMEVAVAAVSLRAAGPAPDAMEGAGP